MPVERNAMGGVNPVKRNSISRRARQAAGPSPTKNSRHRDDAGCGLWVPTRWGGSGCGWVGIRGFFKGATLPVTLVQRIRSAHETNRAPRCNHCGLCRYFRGFRACKGLGSANFRLFLSYGSDRTSQIDGYWLLTSALGGVGRRRRFCLQREFDVCPI